ncbi:MAG: hypothetical protein ABS939_02440 [Psychrobacillus sp.]
MENKLLLKLDLQFFAGGFEDFDLDKFDQQFEESLGAQDEIVEDVVDEQIETTQVEEELTVDQEEHQPEEQPQAQQPDLTEEQKRNAAFAQLRRERDEAAKQAEFIRKLAEENGMTVEDLQKQYEESRLQKESEQKGVPVDVLQRLQQLENENSQVKSQMQAKMFNEQVTSTLQKYNGSDENFNNTIKYAQENGLFEAMKVGAVSFEAAYKLAHMDSMLEDAKKSAVQEDLSKRKQRQQEAPLANGAGATPDDPTLDDLVKADAKALLENF